MRAFLLLAVLLAVPDREDPTPRPKPRTLQEQLLGEWRVEKVAFAGGPDVPGPDMENRTLHFTPTEILVKVNGEPRPADDAGYQLDATKTPVAIDLLSGKGQDKKIEGILKLEGNQLTICFSVDGARPTEFNTATKSIQAVLHLKRIR